MGHSEMENRIPTLRSRRLSRYYSHEQLLKCIFLKAIENAYSHGFNDCEILMPRQKLQSLKCSTDTNNVITFEEKSDGSEEDEEVILGFHWSLFWLAVIAVIVAYESELVADTIEQASINAGISPMFMAAILLPIVGNAAEHAGSIMFAYHNKLELTLGVAVGSSTQIALFVLPFSVVLGWISEHDMGLEFTEYDASTLLIAVISVTFAIKDGSSNWLVGLILICEYVVVSIGYFTLHATSLKSSSIDPALSSPI